MVYIVIEKLVMEAQQLYRRMSCCVQNHQSMNGRLSVIGAQAHLAHIGELAFWSTLVPPLLSKVALARKGGGWQSLDDIRIEKTSFF